MSEMEIRAINGQLEKYAKALVEKDIKAMEALICPKCIIYAFRLTPDGEWRRFTRTREEFLMALSMQEAPPEFIIKNTSVLTRGKLSSVWVDYEFRKGGKRIHEGVESFHFVKPADDWKIVSLIYTAEPISK